MSATAGFREVVGGVTITGPKASGYYKLKWIEPDGKRRETDRGPSLEKARSAAIDIATRISRAAGPEAVTTLGAIKEAYLAQGHSPFGEKLLWQDGHKTQLARTLKRVLKGFEGTEALEVDRAMLDVMRSQAGTDNMVKANTSALKGMLRWGHQARYFTPVQSELLVRGGSYPAPATAASTRRPRRNTRARNTGESAEYISPEDAPSGAKVIDLARELDAFYPTWGQLAVESAANLGFRWGEEFQLVPSDVHLRGCREQEEAHVHVDWQVNSGAKAGSRRSRLTLPKGNKRRIVTITDISFTGFELERALAARVDAALREQEEGSNPDALLFPSATGKMLWHTTFTRHLHAAMRAADWPYTEWVDDRDGKTKTVYHLTWHSMRHRYARICIDDFDYTAGELMVAGGWENELTVKNRYYRSSDENRRSAAAKSRRRG